MKYFPKCKNVLIRQVRVLWDRRIKSIRKIFVAKIKANEKQKQTQNYQIKKIKIHKNQKYLYLLRCDEIK